MGVFLSDLHRRTNDASFSHSFYIAVSVLSTHYDNLSRCYDFTPCSDTPNLFGALLNVNTPMQREIVHVIEDIATQGGRGGGGDRSAEGPMLEQLSSTHSMPVFNLPNISLPHNHNYPWILMANQCYWARPQPTTKIATTKTTTPTLKNIHHPKPHRPSHPIPRRHLGNIA